MLLTIWVNIISKQPTKANEPSHINWNIWGNYVAQTCFCLGEYVRTTPTTAGSRISEILIQDGDQAELALTQVRSPINGRILQVHVQPGEIVGEAGVATLGQTDQMYVIAEVHETDINRVKTGQKAYVFSEYGGFDGELQGTVEKIGLQIHRNSLYAPNPGTLSDARVVEVRIRLEPDNSERVQALTNLQVRAIIN